jgi:deazaflavin-dependent oxidoreductase (nitroreductase family)
MSGNNVIASGERAVKRRPLLSRLTRLLNPLILAHAGSRHLPLFAVVQHHGRRSGRSYATPVSARPTRDGFVIALTFGEQSDWFQNVRAAGGCIIRWKGVDYPMVEPVVIDWAIARQMFSPIERAVVPLIGIERFVQLRHAEARGNISSSSERKSLNGQWHRRVKMEESL